MKLQNLKRLFVKGLAFALILVLCFTLAACGSGTTTSEIVIGDEADDGYEGIDKADISTEQGDGESGGNKGGKINTTSSGGKETTTNAGWLSSIPKSLQGTTVTFGCWGDENAKEYAKVAKYFTKKTKINIKWVTYNEDKYVSTIVEQNAAGKGPDVIINNVTFPSSVEAVQELPAIFDVNDGFWDPRVTKDLSYKGKNYFVNSYTSPFLNGGLFCFYNKQIFSNNNITSPQDYVDAGNWTMETFEKCLRDAHAKGFDGGNVFPQDLWPLTGAGLINYDPSTGTFSSGLNDPSQRSDIVYSFKFVSRLYKEGIISNMPLPRFAQGNMAIAVQGNFSMKYNGWFNGMTPSSLGVVDMPSTFNGKKANYYGLYQRGYGIGKNAKNIEGAYYFLRFFLDINNYDEAGANIFLNKNIERFYKEHYVPNYKKNPVKTEYKETPLSLAGYPWTDASTSNYWKELFDAQVNPEEIDTLLASKANVVDTAVKKANEKLQSAAK
ncbi:MAG: extracellular solute-binding protein [Clostridia bacterium]|nr:extracellular solute-binding protein [Clostridia bacterium]